LPDIRCWVVWVEIHGSGSWVSEDRAMACSDGLRSAHGVHGSVVGRVIAGIRFFLAPLEPSACWAHGSTAEMVLGYRLFAGVWVARVHACTVWVTHTHTHRSGGLRVLLGPAMDPSRLVCSPTHAETPEDRLWEDRILQFCFWVTRSRVAAGLTWWFRALMGYCHGLSFSSSHFLL
jgi:hypothetical protein